MTHESQDACPPLEELLLHLAGEGAPATARHVEPGEGGGGCARCSRRLDLARRVVASLEAPPLVDVSAGLVAEAVALAERQPADGPSLLGRVAVQVREFVATLLPTDDEPTPALVLRGERPGGWRQLYRGGPFELDLGLLEGGDLVGQVEAVEDDAPDLGDATCCLFGEDGAQEVPVEPNGDFLFEGIRPGRYALAVEASGARVVLPEVLVGTGRGESPAP